MNRILTINQLSKSFADQQVLKNISFQLEKGEILFLLGASGCGKTTLLRLIAGFEQAEQGEIWLQQQKISDSQTHLPTQQRKLGYVVQEGVLFPHLNVYRNIAYGLGNGKGKTGGEKSRIFDVMQLTGIAHLADRMPHQLSGGQQQRVALARALAPDPELILLDEPFSALDEQLRQQIRSEMLQALRQSGKSAIFVTHDREEALRYGDKIAVMIAGEIRQLDTPKALYWQPQDLDVAQFIGENLVFQAEYNPQSQKAKCALGDLPASCFAKLANSTSTIKGKLLLRPEQLNFYQTSPNQTQCQSVLIQQIDFTGKKNEVRLSLGELHFALEQPFCLDCSTIAINQSIPLWLTGYGIFYPD